MITRLLTAIFGSKHDRFVKNVKPLVEEINRHFDSYSSLTDEQLREKTAAFKARIEQGETLDQLLPEAFGVAKEACRRMCGKSWKVVGQEVGWEMVPYDVQLMGGIALHQGKIAEMATGEGKTLVAVAPVYLNALTGKGVHLITVNDYLAQRDSEWMGAIYRFLGLSVGVILNNMDNDERRKCYACDITYGTNNEFGFDYLRDNMAVRAEDQVQRNFFFAIVDEVDSVLVDEARTPLIISGPVNTSTDKYDELNPLVKKLFEKQHYLNNELVAAARKLIDAEGEPTAERNVEIGQLLFQVKLGGPKNKQLQKLFQETGVKRLCDEAENGLIRDKQIHVIEEKNYFNINEKNGAADLTDKGREVLAGVQSDKDLFVIPDLSDELVKIDNDDTLAELDKIRKKEETHRRHTDRSERIHIISQLLRAYSLFEIDVEYMVQEGRVIIIDEHTGRALEGRRYSDGLHQAIEAKEKVKVQRESQTLATITLQNYFRMYEKLGGMTGTAETEEGELWEIYKLEVMVIPTNDKVRRSDHEDIVYKTKREKYKAIIDEIHRLHDEGRPVLVGTVSVEVSELIASMLKRQGIKCSVLNAKQHQHEAEIVANAGQKGAVTIATNMAGRGTDIKLGGGVVVYPEGVTDKEHAKGGLFIIGTERHESRRIDRQLRGRAGRQGDPGDSRFYLSLEDDLMRLFGSDRIAGVMDRLGMKENDPIEHPWITKSVERAQKRVEGRNFEIRKHLLEYDNVMNIMRTEIYKRRKSALLGQDVDKTLQEFLDDYLQDTLSRHGSDNTSSGEWDWMGLKEELGRTLGLLVDERHDLSLEELLDQVLKLAQDRLEEKKIFFESLEAGLFERIKRFHILRTIDEMWRDHLFDMDCLREGINLRAYGQKDPLIEYKREGFGMFDELLSKINKIACERIFNTTVTVEEKKPQQSAAAMRYSKPDATALSASVTPAQGEGAPPRENVKQKPFVAAPKVGPNDPCPCGSGKKYKKCCG
ncbi:MAG: preprotein translocase subunit SecA [Elusimicrobia bacterium RIFOXYB2_FULL_49_7]|nr:MAG: preprotein translocase subunit SecA [Elusimicrobia bacterium RIFOXYB2_FULL_49_7]